MAHNSTTAHDTDSQYATAMAKCRDIFQKKLHDYGASWRIMRPQSITDQIFIKAKRIRNLQLTGTSLVGEGFEPEFMGIVNYGIIGLIQLERGFVDSADITSDEALADYDRYAAEIKRLLFAKNHDYDEAWRQMRVSSFVDIILTKIDRNKEIEDNDGRTIASEGVGSNYMDMVNYAAFAIIKLSE